MEYEPQKKLNLPIIMILTGFAFLIGGLFKTFLEWYMTQIGSSFLQICLAIWLGFLVESAIGMAVLAILLRRYYPFIKLWLSGVSAFAVGILISAFVLNQFFYALWILPGILIGLFFSLFLKEKTGKGNLMLMILIGFFICQMLLFFLPYDNSGFIWLYEHLGPWSVPILMHMIEDMIIGIFIALGVGLMLLRKSSLNNVKN